jgi:hypothetical protein
MRAPHVVLALSIIVAATGVAARQQQPATANAKQPAKPLTLSGCINTSSSDSGLFTLSDAKQGTTYRLVGTDVREFVGQHVQVSGVTSRRVQFVGGLYPSPNAAAQAGALSPNEAAIAATSGTATGTRPLLEFRVKSVRATPGACPER